MNPFQRARDEAVVLRKKLLGKRAEEPVHVREFLTPGPLESKLNLGLEYVAKGSLELGDDEAILRRNEETIYVLKDRSESERAYLVAHELGHYKLDEDLEEVTIASLKALTAVEGSPAVVTVEAYGARERQELRANVFARELQLPRDVARRLFEAGLGPRKVAKDLGIHLEIVRQQILDAVLLPNVPASVEAKVQHPPSPDQVKAVKAPERFVNVVAGPGSGKTSTLVHRVQYLIEKLGVDPSHILVLTFTNKAAFELVDRLRDAKIARASDVWAGTFHAFGLEFLRKFHQHFGLEADLVVADRLNAITRLNHELPSVELKCYRRVQDPYEWLPDVVSAIKRLKEELVSPEQYRRAIESLATESESVKLRREDVAALYERHEQMLRDNKFVDFVDLVALPAKAIELDRPRYSELADKFKYILVDEYQDVTRAMVHLITQLAKGEKSLWVVGDVRQAIHHWRGASVHSLTKFNEQFQVQATTGKIRTYPLEFNRRSSAEILEIVQQIGHRHVLERTALKLVNTIATAGKQGHVPALVSCIPWARMPDAIAKQITLLQAEGLAYGKQAVLSRKNYELHNVAAALRQASIPVLHIGELAQRAEVKKLLCLMQLLVERLPRALVGLMGEPSLAVDMKDFRQLMEACAADPSLHRGAWRDAIPKGLSAKSRDALTEVVKLLDGQVRRCNPWSFVCDMVLERRFGYPGPHNQSVDAHAVRIALWQFAYAARAGDGERKIPTLPRFLLRQQLRHRIGETYAERELPPEAAALDAVRLLSVHGAKGLEFEAVHVNNVNTDDYGPKGRYWEPPVDILEIVPPEVLGSTAKDWAFETEVERNNLLYVAVSRARRRLFIYENGEQSDKHAPQLHPVAAPCQRLSFAGKPVAASGAGVGVPPVPRTDAMPFDEFETYVRCPLQHWYRYTLQMPGEQQVDVALKARWAVMAALKEYAQKTGKSKKELFVAAWKSQKLPGKEDDPQLWKHAAKVFIDGVAVVDESAGTFAEPVTAIEGLAIRLNWMLVDATRRQPALDLIRFPGGNLDSAAKLLRPMLNKLKPVDARGITIHSLLGAEKKLFPPTVSHAMDKTVAYGSVKKYAAGNRDPHVAHHCRYCAYSTMCPTQPAP